MAERPSELAITLAAIPSRWAPPSTDGGWVFADEIRARLHLLGFDATTQQVAAWLGRMSRVQCPWIERCDNWGDLQYRVTRYGKTDVDNRLPGVRLHTPWLDVPNTGSRESG